VRELVHHAHLWLPPDDGVDIHLLHRDTPIFNLSPWKDFEILELRFSITTAIRLDVSDDDVEAARSQRVCPWSIS
jgi:hypothetical protein